MDADIAFATLDSADCDDFTQHLVRLDPWSRHTRFGRPMDDRAVRAHGARLRQVGAVVTVARLEGVVRAAVECRPVEGGTRAGLAVAVEAAFQNRGLGRALVGHALAAAAAAGFTSAVLPAVLPGHVAMERIAQRFGARLVADSRRQNWVIDPLPDLSAGSHPGPAAAPALTP